VEIRPPPHCRRARRQDRVRQRHRDPVTAGSGRTQAGVAAQERQRDGQPEGQPQHDVDRAEERHAGGREQWKVRRHRKGTAEPRRLPARQVPREQVHGPGGGQQPSSAQGPRAEERSGVAHERGDSQGTRYRQGMPHAARRRPPGPARPRTCPCAPPVQGVGQGGAPAGAHVGRTDQDPHRGSAQAPARAVDPARMAQDLPGPGDLRRRLLRLAREEQGDAADRRREPRADVAPG
jgi:hypothetical protein